MNDTQKLQELLDKKGIVVFPDGKHVITSPLVIRSNTRLICSPATEIFLADGSNCPMLMNKADEETGYSSHFTIEGGIWNGNNVGQKSKELVMMLTGVRDFTVRDLTVKDPGGFCIMLTDSERFTVENVIFDCNNKTLNQDGLHVNGYARDGYIHNLKGHTNDDMVALNADEGEFTGTENDIENITIDGIYGGDNGWTGIRLLSRIAQVRHITIRNLYGAYKFNAVNFTHWSKVPGSYGYFDDILLENIHASSCRMEGTGHGGLIWFQEDLVHIGTVVIDGCFRTEEDPLRNTTSLIEVGNRVHIRDLTLTRLHEKIPDDKPTVKIADDAVIDCLRRD